MVWQQVLFSHLVISPEPASIVEQQAIDQQLLRAKGKQVMESIFNRLIETRGQPYQVQMKPSAKPLVSLNIVSSVHTQGMSDLCSHMKLNLPLSHCIADSLHT